MPRDLDDPGWVKVQERLAEALAPFAPDFGARECDHGNFSECEEECGFDDSRPKAGSMPVIQHWLLLAATPDMAQGTGMQPDMVAIDGFNQPGYVSRGMANDSLNG